VVISGPKLSSSKLVDLGIGLRKERRLRLKQRGKEVKIVMEIDGEKGGKATRSRDEKKAHGQLH